MAIKREPFDMQIKLITIGDTAVGKTNLLLRYANDTFSPHFITTIGVDYRIKTLTINGKKVRLQIWDTAGQERFRTITTSYFRGAQGIMLVFDVTMRKSFDSIKSWVEQISLYGDQHVKKVLLGNKCDMESDRVVSRVEAEALAHKFGMAYFETSAKTGVGVAEPFAVIAQQVVDRVERMVAAATEGMAAGGAGLKTGAVQIKGGGAPDTGGGGCCGKS